MSSSRDTECFEPLIQQACVLTGPTASGKSRLAIRWAKAMDGEIMSLDSIAVYQEMDIGTAKPSLSDRQTVPHHLIDLVPPNEEFSVACYLRAAHQKTQEILSRGKTPIFVGGTPMFLKAILRGFDPGPPADWDFRNSVEADLAEHGIDALQTRLRQVDPLSAHRIDPHDTRRMIRALEVARATGQPMSHQQTQFDRAVPADQCRVFALAWPRDQLHDRIEHRVEQMFHKGLVEEVRGLIDRYGELSRTARQAVGYREVIEHLDGKWSLEETIEQVTWHTRRLARRQETWFRSFSEIRKLEMDSSLDVQGGLETILAQAAR